METRDVRIVLEKGGQVEGWVEDSQGQRIAGARVLGQDISSSGGMKEVRDESDENGHFILSNILSENKIEIEVSHPDYGSWSSQNVAVGTRDLRVILAKLGGVKGTVVNSNGTPVATFSVHPSPKGGTKASKQLDARPFRGAAGQGAFEYTGIPPGLYDINFRSSGYAVQTVPDVQVSNGVLDLGRVVLEEGGIISGFVVDPQGRPIAGADVRVVGGASRFQSPSLGARNSSNPSRTATDSRGVFEFRNLRSGVVSLQVKADSYVKQKVDRIDPNVPSTARNLQVVLDLGCEIFGVVTDANGAAQNGVQVFLSDPGGGPTGNQRTATNSEGTYQFKGLSQGTYRVWAQRTGRTRSGAADRSQEVGLNPGDSREVPLIVD